MLIFFSELFFYGTISTISSTLGNPVEYKMRDIMAWYAAIYSVQCYHNLENPLVQAIIY